MRVSVAKVEMEKLTEGIFEFEDKNGESPEYIIMSQETFSALEPYPNIIGKCVQVHTHPTVCGIPVAVCNAVPFGEVDLV